MEETFELDLDARDTVAMQCRQPSLEGLGEISLRRLIKEALRMRPDRLVVGEVREAEALDLLIALNSGLPGMCSVHANSARDALSKLCTLPLLAERNIDSGPSWRRSRKWSTWCTANSNVPRAGASPRWSRLVVSSSPLSSSRAPHPARLGSRIDGLNPARGVDNFRRRLRGLRMMGGCRRPCR